MSQVPDAASAYRESSFENAPPLKILRMLYQGAIRFIDQAIELDPAADAAHFNEKLGRADAIVCELRCSLAREHAPELCDQLESLYLFVEKRIDDAFQARDAQPVREARVVLTKLLDGWKQIELGSEHLVR